MRIFTSIITGLVLSVSATAGDVYAGLRFGDTEKEVIAKLELSKLTHSDVPKTLFARVGLNGSFKVVPKLKNLSFALYFDWAKGAEKKLTSIILRSNKLPASDYDTKLKNAYDYTVNLLSSTYGRPSNSGSFPTKEKVGGDEQVHFSHEWKTDEGFVYLGVGQQAGEFVLTINFTKDSLISR